MNPATQHSIGEFVVVLQSVPPQSSAAATISGASIDRFAHNVAGSAVLHQALGAISGSPSAASVQTSIQHSPDSSTWTNFIASNTYPNVAQTPALSTANTDTAIPVDLSAALRYIRAVTTVAFTGGTSPSAIVSADIAIGGETRLAAV